MEDNMQNNGKKNFGGNINTKNYALRKDAKINLSLISGPPVWDLNFRTLFGKMTQSDFCNYPSPPESRELLLHISDFDNVPESWIMLTPGADVAIEIVCRRFAKTETKVGIINPTFPRFESIFATLENIEIVHHDDLTSVNESDELICLCTPNNPTTSQLPRDLLIEKINSYPNSFFCIDAVFERYGDYSIIEIAKKYKNVIVLKSFSKIGLAGIRLGYIISHPDNIEYLRIANSPFMVPRITQEIGLAILKQIHRLEILDERINNSYNQINNEIGEFVIRDSRVPFFLLNSKVNSNEAEKLLYQDNISVVGEHEFRGLGSKYLRVALGTKKENEFLIECLIKRKII